MKYLPLLGLLFVIVLTPESNLHAQAKLGLYTTSVSNSTPNLGDQLSIFTKLKNVSPTDTFTGIINFSLANKDSIITNVSIVGKPAFTGTSITLAPLEEKAALFTVQLQPSYFKTGPDIIIVWPVALAQIVDTAKAPIDIQSALDITNSSADKMTIYVANEQLIIQNAGVKNSLQYVRIFDITGRLIEIHTASGASYSIPLYHLPKGVYIVEISGANENSERMRFMK